MCNVHTILVCSVTAITIHQPAKILPSVIHVYCIEVEMHARVVLGVGKCALFREVSSAQECPHRERFN